MAHEYSYELTLSSPEQMTALAKAIAPILHPGTVLLLSGEVGAGKTHFSRAVIQARLATAGMSEDVPSPTFTLVQTYCDGVCDIWHADLYRLSQVSEIEELGLIDAFETAICLVEWPDRLGDHPVPNALSLDFNYSSSDDSRQVKFRWKEKIWKPLRSILGQFHV